MIKVLMISLLAFTILAGCDKDDDPPATLKGRWNLVNYTEKEYSNNLLINTVVEPGGGIQYDFQNNDRLIITEPGQPDNIVSYVILSSTEVEIGFQRFEIRDLTNSSVTLYDKVDFGGGDYEEAYVNLSR